VGGLGVEAPLASQVPARISLRDRVGRKDVSGRAGAAAVLLTCCRLLTYAGATNVLTYADVCRWRGRATNLRGLSHATSLLMRAHQVCSIQYAVGLVLRFLLADSGPVLTDERCDMRAHEVCSIQYAVC
jgi:hypothetical protein